MSSPLFSKLSSNYFFYFAILGLVIPFLPVYLDFKGLNSLQIGEVLAIFTATKIIGPTLWANLADKTGQQLTIIRFGALFACISFSLLIFVDSYWPIAFVLAIFSLFWTAILPQLEVHTLSCVRRSAKIYARVRLWGSLGFIVFAVLAGEVIAKTSPNAFSFIGLVILLALYLSTLSLKANRLKSVVHGAKNSIFSTLFTANFILFFLSGLLLQISFGPYYSFFALYLRDLNYPVYAVGVYISLGVVAEIFIFIVVGRLYQRFSMRLLLILSFLFTALRWYVTGNYAGNAGILALSQLLHAASFGLYHSVSISFIEQYFNADQQNRGQAIYISGVYGLGGAIGAYLAGFVWLDGVGAQAAYQLASYLAVIAALLALMIKRASNNQWFYKN